MASSQDKWLMTLAIVTIIAVVATIGTLVTERNRDASVSKLRAETAAAIEPYASQSRTSDTSASPGLPSTAPADPGPSQKERFARFQSVFIKRNVLQAEPSREDADRILGMTPEERTEADIEILKQYLATCSDLIRELRQLAESGGPVYELDFSKGYEMELPHLAQLRDCARLLTADAAVQAEAGNYGEAVKDLLAAMKLADALNSEPILISQLVRIAMDNIVYGTVSAHIPGGELPPEMARELIEYAAHANHREAFANSFNGEGFFGLEAFEEIRSGNTSPVVEGNSPSTVWGALGMRVYGSLIGRPWLNMDEADFANAVGRMGEAANLPYYEAKPVFEQIEADIEDLPRTRVLTRTLLPALTRAAEAQARHEAFLGLMSLGLAVEQYHAENGQYPQTLNEIAPMLGGPIPPDPFTGQPFGYEASADSFTLFSRMSALSDLRRSGLPLDEHGNLVWRRAPLPSSRQ